MTQSKDRTNQPNFQDQEFSQPGISRRQFITFGTAAAAAAFVLPNSAQAKGRKGLGKGQKLIKAAPDICPSDTTFYQPYVITSQTNGDHGTLTSTLNIVDKEYSDVGDSTTYVRAFEQVIPPIDSTPALAPGPTLCVNPGDEIQLTINNNLPANTPPPPSTGGESTYCPDDESLMNRPNCLNTVNLHFHGLHVSPISIDGDGNPISSGRDPNVVRSSDDVLYSLPPSSQDPDPKKNPHQYCPWLPAFHAPGTHWYHSHRHGSTAIQVGGGMVGALIVKEPADQELCQYAPNVVMLVQEAAQSLISQDFGTKTEQIEEFNLLTAQEKLDRGVYERTGRNGTGTFLVNGQINPTITLKKGEIQRWRIINANSTPRAFIKLELRAGDCTAVDCNGVPNGTLQTVYRVAVDGITLYGKPMTDSSVQFTGPVSFAPGNRADLLVQLPDPSITENPPSTYTLWKIIDRDLVNAKLLSDPQPLLTINVNYDEDFEHAAEVAASFQNLLDNGIPTTGKPGYLNPILAVNTENQTPVVFNTGGSNLPKNPDGSSARVTTPGRGKFSITNSQYEAHETPELVASGLDKIEGTGIVENITADLNDSQEWIVANISNTGHPFHIHVNPFLVVETAAIHSETATAISNITGTGSADQEEIHNILNNDLDWTVDGLDPTVWWDTFTIAPNTAYKIRHRFDDYWGTYVLHCHLLIHEDQGMMWNVNVNNVDDLGADPCEPLLSPVKVPALPTGTKIALKADIGKWFSRCNNCQNTIGNNPDTITVHIDDPTNKPYAQFEIVNVGSGKIALRADTGKYAARCRNCIVNGAYPDFLTVHIDDPSLPYAQFTPEYVYDANGNLKLALKADTGKYVARCRNCSPGAAYPDQVTIHVDADDLVTSPWALWDLQYMN